MTTVKMDPTGARPDLCERLSRLLGEQAGDLTAQWAGLLSDNLKAALSPFPTPQDPQLVRGIADCLAGPQPRMVCTMELIQRARALGEAAEARHLSPELVLDACNVLNEMLWGKMGEVLALSSDADARSVSTCVRRLHEAMIVVIRGVTDAYFRAHQERIERDEARLKSFNRMVGHELKNPIATIHGAAALLTDEFAAMDAERRVHFISMVKRNAERATDLVNDLLALTTADRSDAVDAPGPVPLGEVANRVRERLLDEADLSGVRIEIEGALPTVITDPRALDLVLTNLMWNAIRYGDPEKTDRYVRVAARQSDEAGVWTVTVADNGRGIPAIAKERIFERFYRADAVREIPGTGLGLSIVQDTVTGWKGRVGFDSTEGVGTSFWFTLRAVETTGVRSSGDDGAIQTEGVR